jgi:ABC-2 type transport system permease protein
MALLKKLLLFAQKELKVFMTDRLALFFFVVFPFFFVILFRMMSWGNTDRRLVLHLATQEQDGLSQMIIAAIETKDTLKLEPGEPWIVWHKNYDEARQAVEEKRIPGILVFPADFTGSIYQGYGSDIKIMADPEAVNTKAALTGMARAICSRVTAQHVAMNAVVALLIENEIAGGKNYDRIGKTIQKSFAGQADTSFTGSYINYVHEKIGNIKPANPSNWLIPGYLVMFVFFAAALGAGTIIRERQNQTLERLIASSVPKDAIVLGTFAGIMAKGLVQIIIFWLVGIFIFRVDLGPNPLGVVILSLFVVTMSSAFAVMLGTLARTQRSASSLGVFASLVLAPLGGCWWPLFVTPRWLQFMAKITPHAWATTGFNKMMLFGAGFGAVAPEMLALAGFTVLFGLVAIVRFRTDAV